MISSAENDELPVPAVELLPVALYDVGDELDCESCSDCKNCCRMLLEELALDELLLVPPVGDELPIAGEAPWPPWPPP